MGTATITTAFVCNPQIPLTASGGDRFPLTRGRRRPVVVRTHPRIRIPEAAVRRAEDVELAPVLHLVQPNSGQHFPRGG